MALHGHVVRQLRFELLQQGQQIAPRIARRTFVSQAPAATRAVRSARYSKTISKQLRSFSQSSIARSTSQAETAPNAKAYLESGAIAGAQNLIDVKKVRSLDPAVSQLDKQVNSTTRAPRH